MDTVSTTITILGFLAAMFAILRYLDTQRAAALQRVAIEMGFQYDDDRSPLDQRAWAAIQLFNHGHDKILTHLLSGTAAGTNVALFDYSYTVGYGKGSATYRQTAAAFRINTKVPVFQLGPENLLHKLTAMVGYEDIDFDSNTDFSKRYVLRGPDENAIRAFFNPAILRFFESLPTNKWHVESGGGWLVVYVWQKRRKPQEMPSFLNDTQQIYSSLRSNTTAFAV